MGYTMLGADFHVGHPNILRTRPRFATLAEHDEFIWDLIAPLRKQDTLILVGDCFLSREALFKFRRFPCRKKLVLGNHDTDHKVKMPDLVQVFDSIDLEIKRPGGFAITHMPKHPISLRNKTNVHGHEHKMPLRDPRYINISLEVAGYRLVSLDEITNGSYRTHDRASLNPNSRSNVT